MCGGFAFSRRPADRHAGRTLRVTHRRYDASMCSVRPSGSIEPCLPSRFVAIRGTDFLCPRCWIDHETRSDVYEAYTLVVQKINYAQSLTQVPCKSMIIAVVAFRSVPVGG
jgi:hypothetical protein